MFVGSSLKVFNQMIGKEYNNCLLSYIL